MAIQKPSSAHGFPGSSPMVVDTAVARDGGVSLSCLGVPAWKDARAMSLEQAADVGRPVSDRRQGKKSEQPYGGILRFFRNHDRIS